MKIDKLISQSIKLLGNNKNLSIFLGCNERTVYRWLSGQVKPNVKYVILMMDLVSRMEGK